MANYYIRIDTFWQNSPDYWFGPYRFRKEAEEAIADSGIFDARKNVMAVDVKNQTRCLGVFSRTESKWMGRTEDNTFPADILPTDSEQLELATGEYYNAWHRR